LYCNIALAAVLWAGAAAPSGERWFPTGPPRLEDRQQVPRIGLRLTSRAEYPARAAELSRFPSFVPVREFPEEGRPLIGLANHLTLGAKHPWVAFYGAPGRGYAVYADTDADGSFRNERPVVLTPGEYGLLETVATDDVDGQPMTHPVTMAFALLPPHGTWTAWTFALNSVTTRDGMIDVDGKSMAFRLWGSFGVYGEKRARLWLDLDGDGSGFDEFSPELFHVHYRTVTIGNSSYTFRVDRLGRGLGLTRLPDRIPDRPEVGVGKLAPALTPTDIDDRPFDLARLRGKVVLLAFGAAGCPGAQQDAPKLVELARRFGPRGLDIVGIGIDSPAEVRAFAKEWAQDWVQLTDPPEGPLHSNYRVEGYPQYFLVGRDGRLLKLGLGSEELEEHVERALTEKQ